MPFYHSKIKCCIAVQQAYRALGRLPQVEFEQLTERNSSKRNGGCLAQGANITPLWTVWSSLCPNLNIFLLHTLCFIAIQPFWPAHPPPQNLPLGPPTIVTASWHTNLRPCPYSLTAPIPLHTYPTPCTSSYTLFWARLSQQHALCHKAEPLCGPELLQAKKLPGQHCKQPIL